MGFAPVIFDVGGVVEITTHRGELGTLSLPDVEHQIARALDLDQPQLHPRRHAGVRRGSPALGVTAITFLETDSAIAELDLQLGGRLGE